MDNTVAIITSGVVDYDTSLEMQLEERHRVLLGKSPGAIFLLEHDPPVVTMGRHAVHSNILVSERELADSGYAVREIDRGGDITVHEPGQLVLYIVLPVPSKKTGPFVRNISTRIAGILNRSYPLSCAFNEKVPGLFTSGKKIGSIGFDLRGGVSMHGMALNICNSLRGFDFIIPCGHRDTVMTSLSRELDRHVPVDEVVEIMKDNFAAMGMPL